MIAALSALMLTGCEVILTKQDSTAQQNSNAQQNSSVQIPLQPAEPNAAPSNGYRQNYPVQPFQKAYARFLSAPNSPWFHSDTIYMVHINADTIAKNIITAYGVEPNQVRGAAMAAFIERAHLVGELNDRNTQIKDLQEKLKVLKKYRKVKHIGAELKALSGREEKSTARNTAAILPNITKPANRFWSFTRQAIFRKSKNLKSISHLCRKSCRRKIRNTIKQIRSPVSCPKLRGQ